MKSSGSEDDFGFFKYLRKEKEITESIYSWKKEQGQFHLLVKELWDYPNHFQAYFRISVNEFDTHPALLALHNKQKKKIL